jgi:hypothetical protein
MTRTLAILCLAAFFALHQDFWLWRDAHPLFLGVLPAGLTYHAVYTLVACVVVSVVARAAGVQEAEDEGR